MSEWRNREISVGGSIRVVLRQAYRSNPFYLISAALVMVGLAQAMPSSRDAAYSWALLGSLAAYALLLAGVGVLVVRLGKLWDDARTIFLAVLLTLLGMSACFDRVVIDLPTAGTTTLMVAYVFAVFVCEATMCAARLRLTMHYRLPLYGILGILFAVPPVLRGSLGLLQSSGGVSVVLGLYLFPAAAAAAFLALIPAIRRGRDLVRDNGTPWGWPWFPWLLFGLLGAAVAVRSYWLTIAFYTVQPPAQPWMASFLWPLLTVLGVLLIEASVCARRPGLAWFGWAAVCGGLGLAFPITALNPYQEQVLRVLDAGLLAPPLLAALATVAAAAYAAWRRAPAAEVALTLALIAVYSVIPLNAHAPVRLIPLALAAVLQVAQAIRLRTSWRAAVACALVLVVLAQAAPPTARPVAVPVLWHVFFACMVAVSSLWRDRLARIMRHACAAALVGAFIGALSFGVEMAPAPALNSAHVAYLCALAASSYLLWRALDCRTYLVASVAMFGLALAYVASALFQELSTTDLPQGAQHVAWGLVALLAGIGLSVVKMLSSRDRDADGHTSQGKEPQPCIDDSACR